MSSRCAGPFVHIVLALFIAATVAACADDNVFENKSLVATSGAQAAEKRFSGAGYTVGFVEERRSDVLVILAMSGGGKRSSAFSYGVLRGLRDYAITAAGKPTTLLAETDVITAVSGGSFTAAYYGLYREKIFSDYEKEFLKQDINSYIYGMYLLPWNWRWMVSPNYGTNDRMQQIYDQLMFKGATYADLIKRGPPMIWLGATDISYGTSFSFNQYSFDMLCSDLPSFPLARAVAASNGFPVLFTPITLTSHSQDCGGTPAIVKKLRDYAQSHPLSREAIFDREAESMSDPNKTRYVHLMDGGISDNLALRNVGNMMMLLQIYPEYLTHPRWLATRRILIVSVDGQAAQDKSRAMNRTVSSLGQILDAVTGGQIDRYNEETMLLIKQQAEEFADSLEKARCAAARAIDGHPCGDVEATVVHLSLGAIADAATRHRLGKIPTGLTVANEDVDALVDAGTEVVRQSPDLQLFRSRLGSSRAPR